MTMPGKCECVGIANGDVDICPWCTFRAIDALVDEVAETEHILIGQQGFEFLSARRERDAVDDAVSAGNALCQAIRERDALRKQVENWSDELADALGCVNEHSGARQQPCFAEMVEMMRRLREERDDLMGERELLRCRVAETETEVTRARNEQQSTLRDQVAMAALPQLLGQVERTTDLQCHITYEETCAEALRIADAFLKERSK